MIRELTGSNGKIVGSRDYFEAMSSQYLQGLMRYRSSVNRYYDLYKDIVSNIQSKKYSAIVAKYKITKQNTRNLKGFFAPVANMMIQDISRATKDTYITDANGNQMNLALIQLGLCGISGLDRTIKQMNACCWYIDVKREKVKQLQKNLNKMGLGPLTENGIFDKKTNEAMKTFSDGLCKGTFPSLTYVDPLQTGITGVYVKLETRPLPVPDSDIYKYYSLENIPDPYETSIMIGKNLNLKDKRVFQIDKPHMEDAKPLGYHINVNKDFAVPKPLQKIIYNHKAVTEEVFLKFTKFDDTVEKIKIGGRVLLVAGIILDTIYIYNEIVADLNDADKKLGAKTATAITATVMSWGTAAAGAELGAEVGAMVGTAILPGVGTVVGGFVLGLVGGITGAFLGRKAGECIIDLTLLE